MLRRRRSLAIGLALAAVVAAVSAVAVQAATTDHIKTVANKFAFSTKTLRATHGKVTIVMTNVSSLGHAIAVTGNGVNKKGKTVGKGKNSTVTVTLKKGTYTFYCPVPGHRAAGMVGKLIVK